MTGTGVPASPGQEHASEEPPRSPAMVRAAKLNAANMARSLLPLVAICLLLAGWVALRQSADERIVEVDPTSSERTAAENASYDVLVPTGLGDDYRTTSARVTPSAPEEGQPVTLEVGYLTPSDEYAGYVISDDPGADPLRRVLGDAVEEGTASIGGRTWTRSSVPGPDGDETALTLTQDGVTVLVSGSATDDELEAIAGSLQPYSG